MKFNDLDQRDIRELPTLIKDILSNVFEDVISEKANGKALSDTGNQYTDNINMIPSKNMGQCCSILVAICYDKDYLEQRLQECFDHASIKCGGINEQIFFITTQWNSLIVNKFCGYINSLRKNGIDVTMIYVTNNGMVIMPI